MVRLRQPALLLALLACVHVSHGCTTVLATPESTVDGSGMVSHSNDGDGTVDPRLVRVEAADHAAGSMRDVFFAPEVFPRYVGHSRGVKEYFPKGNQTAFHPIGSIPQVPRTFAYFEATYGIINENQVGIAESTCSGVFGTLPVGQGGKALLSIDTLSQIAMERASTAKEAVQWMGTLAEKHGFYGAGSFEGTAESLLVTDPKEGWVFHVLPDPTGTSAVWAAQRVPAGHVSVVPNMFIIRDIDEKKPLDFLFSKNVFSVAKAKGWWTPGTPLDFTKVYSDGEYASKFYSGRRFWRAYNLLAPSQAFPTEYEDLRVSSPYPFSVKPDKKVSLQDVFAVMRDTLQDTPFDLTRGLAAGPFGLPERYAPGDGEKAVHGAWERAIALARTSDSFVVQARGWLDAGVGGLVWFGPHGAHATCYVPFAIGMTALPAAYTTGDPGKLDRASAYWAHRYVENLANLRWNQMIANVNDAQAENEAASFKLVAELSALGPALSPALLTNALSANAYSAVFKWWGLADSLMETYADGFIRGEGVGYPAWWLTAVGYANGPPPPPKGKRLEWTADLDWSKKTHNWRASP